MAQPRRLNQVNTYNCVDSASIGQIGVNIRRSFEVCAISKKAEKKKLTLKGGGFII